MEVLRGLGRDEECKITDRQKEMHADMGMK